jgi:hypothetical protein
MNWQTYQAMAEVGPKIAKAIGKNIAARWRNIKARYRSLQMREWAVFQQSLICWCIAILLAVGVAYGLIITMARLIQVFAIIQPRLGWTDPITLEVLIAQCCVMRAIFTIAGPFFGNAIRGFIRVALDRVTQ